MGKKGYYGNDGFSLAWDLGVIRESWKKNFFFNLGLKGVIEKCSGCFLAYLFLRGFLIKKGAMSGVCVIALRTHCYLWKVCYYYGKIL